MKLTVEVQALTQPKHLSQVIFTALLCTIAMCTILGKANLGKIYLTDVKQESPSKCRDKREKCDISADDILGSLIWLS